MTPPRAQARALFRAETSFEAVVVGAGRSGRSAAALLAGRGARVRLVDDRARDGLEPGPDGRPVALFRQEVIDAAELVVLSPGVPRARRELSRAALEDRLVGEVELASWCIDIPLLGITGTNGKSTTTALAGEMLRASGKRPFVGGNFGTPLSELARQPGDADVGVVELSSYQLESIVDASFQVGVWLNIQPDHLDRYSDLEAYARAKARLHERVPSAGTVIANAADPVVARWTEKLSSTAKKRWFGRDLGAGQAGTRIEEQHLRYEGRTIEVSAPGLLGPHNLENAAAALEAATSLGATLDGVQTVLSSFAGLPHRLQLVHEAGGVRWYDDSKATNVASAITAVLAMPASTLLIAGGKDKGGAWGPLVEACRGRVTRVLSIGEAAPIVGRAFAGVVPVQECKTLERAIAWARAEARQGQCVLLAPACASFDQFRSYVDRGERFARLAREEWVER